MTGPLGGAPKGNTNATKHGAFSTRLPLCGVHRLDWGAREAAYRYRKQLEQAVTNKYQVISAHHADLINAACEAYIVLRRLSAALKRDRETITIGELCKLEELRSRERERRLDYVRRLQLDGAIAAPEPRLFEYEAALATPPPTQKVQK